MKDKTYFFEHNGEMVRVRTSKKPSRETVKALKAMVEAVKNRLSGTNKTP